MRLLLLLLLPACAPLDALDPASDELDWPLPGEAMAVPAGGELTVDVLREGQPATFRVTGVGPRQQLTFGFSEAGAGAGPCPPTLGGVCLGLLAPIQLLGRPRTNAFGEAEITITVPARAGADLCFQVASNAYDRVSNVVCRTIQPAGTAQPGPYESKDVWTTSVYSYAPGGGGPGGGMDEERLRIGGWGDEYRVLVEIDLTGMPAAVSSARFELFDWSNENTSPPGIMLDQITGPWDWRLQGSGSDLERLWWVDQPSTTSFQGPLSPGVEGSWLSVDITDLYLDWMSGAVPNYGLMLRPTGMWNNFTSFHASENSVDPLLRPRIVVTP